MVKQLYQAIAKLVSRNSRYKQMLVHAIPDLLAHANSWEDHHAVAELQLVLRCSEREATILLLEAIEEFPGFAKTIIATKHFLKGPPHRG